MISIENYLNNTATKRIKNNFISKTIPKKEGSSMLPFFYALKLIRIILFFPAAIAVVSF